MQRASSMHREMIVFLKVNIFEFLATYFICNAMNSMNFPHIKIIVVDGCASDHAMKPTEQLPAFGQYVTILRHAVATNPDSTGSNNIRYSVEYRRPLK
jgi:hypothetical protein